MDSRGTCAVNTPVSASQIVVGVGAVVWNARGEVLLIRRANPPKQNEWSLPGGRVEFGEPLRDALLRELREETGLEVEILGLLDVAELIPEGGDDRHYVLVDFTARVKSGDLSAGSDAADARWFTMDELAGLPFWSETRRVIELSAATLANK
jgi:8-oxo-dGTP diphosphatase